MPEEKRVSEWALEWLEKQMQRGLSKNTAGSYRQWTCQRIVPEFLDIALTDLTEAHIQDFYESLACKGLSQNSISLTYDGVHFTEQGHKAFASGLLEVLK